MNNPIRVSIIPGDYQGCGYYRMMQVMEEMNYTGTEFHLMNLGPATFRTKIKKSQKEHYTDISDESHFVGLNSTTHAVLHFLWGDGARRYDWKKRLERLKDLCELMDELNGK